MNLPDRTHNGKCRRRPFFMNRSVLARRQGLKIWEKLQVGPGPCRRLCAGFASAPLEEWQSRSRQHSRCSLPNRYNRTIMSPCAISI